MKAIQPSKFSKSNPYGITYVLRHYILYIVHFITYFISLLRRLVNKFGKLVNKIQKLVNKLINGVLGLYSYNSLWRRSGTFSAIVLIILFGLIIVPAYNKVSEVEAATSSQTAPTLTLNVTNATANLDLVVSDDDGTFAKSNSDVTFTVATNNFTGYTLSIKSSSSSTDLSGSSGSFTSISSSMDSTTFDKSDYNGKWGYLPSKYNSFANTTTYYPSPNTTGNTIDSTSSANSAANSYTIGIGARADYSKPVGTYSNTYILTTVINSFSYSISYNKGNTTDTVTNLPSTQTASSTSATSVVLSSAEPTRDGYAFTGWCSVTPTISDDADSCSGDTYSTEATYYFNKTLDNANIALYAMWEKDASLTFFDITYMQEMTGEICHNTTTPSNGATTITHSADSSTSYVPETTLIDSRDNRSYVVRKLADGNCWMSQNLALGSTSQTTKISSADSDLNTISSYELPILDTTDVTWATNANDVNSMNIPHGFSTQNSWVSASGNGGLITNGSATSVEADIASSGAPASGIQYVGNFYNFAAAIASDASSITKASSYGTGESAPNSICPLGWRLPTDSSSVNSGIGTFLDSDIISFPRLFRVMGMVTQSVTTYATRSNPISFVSAGYYGGNIWNSKTSAQYMTASGFTSGGNAYYNRTAYTSNQYFGSSTINKANAGGAIRCVARRNEYDYSIRYIPNNGSSMTKITGHSSAVVLSAENVPTKSGYSFRGWALVDGGEPVYQPGDFVEFFENTSLSLYAVWSNNIVNMLTSISTMQQMTPSICEQTTTPSPYDDASIIPKATLRDTRDNQSYTVLKFADGNCWMGRNLQLSFTSSTTLYNTDTDLNSKASWRPGVATQTSGTYSWVTNHDTGNSTNSIHSYATGNSTYGNLYNWQTATALSGTYSMTSGDATDSICPKGWTLPSSFGEKSWYNLIDAYNFVSNAASATRFQQDPFNMAITGYYQSYGDKGWAYVGESALYHTKTAFNTSQSGNMGYSTGGISPFSSNSKGAGNPIRCLAR